MQGSELGASAAAKGAEAIEHGVSDTLENESNGTEASSNHAAQGTASVKSQLGKQLSNDEFVDAPIDIESPATGVESFKDCEVVLSKAVSQQEQRSKAECVNEPPASETSAAEASQADNPILSEISESAKDVYEATAAPVIATEGDSKVHESSQGKSDQKTAVKSNQDVAIPKDLTEQSLPASCVAPQNGSYDAVSKSKDEAKPPTVVEDNHDVVGTPVTEEVSEAVVDKKGAGNADELKILEEMRAKIAEMDPESKDTDEATLRRFLRARAWKLSKAVKMFVDHQTWRRSFVPLGYIPKEEIKNELDAEKVFLQGHDKKGRPIVVIMAAKHDANKRKFDEFKRYCVFNFDTTVACLKPGEETFTVILDLKGLGYKNVDVRGWISTFEFLQAYYPERLGMLFIIHVPKVFWGGWKLVYPFIDKVTREKIVFVEDKLIEEKLREEIENDQIPDIYGGGVALVPIQNVALVNQPPRVASSV
ncbi:phosphatidylinositol/phosphatidylcholine transfer protein SFH12 isoform X2 [Physcomitrium patens]|uniref:CRAL-TRIO domain-containing protein n=1 Tax=Physcomitrium patens TaxID=3218 RepID=A0A7I4A6B3_PHYPA|nr:CRAL-TRIO domain-containing protein C23B6.04c-like isoform X2 [Physcomitrium patens]|eukprot:XP_024389860.1 CRAL-TRIO domain-containing protein C23B6.04c-like isoform X2 [Physcomitrella patens]